jgi:Xaa-Pro dipeptidase
VAEDVTMSEAEATKADRPAMGADDGGSRAMWKNPDLVAHAYGAPILLNIERARAIMDKYDLAGIVASIPHNIQYLSSHGGIMQWMGRHFSTYAFFPRDENAEPALIINGTMLYHLDYRPTWISNIKAIAAPKLSATGEAILNANGDPEAVKRIGIWQVRPDADMTRGDLIQLALFAGHEHSTVVSALHGLKDAIVEGGGERRRIGFDDPRVGAWLADIALTDMTTVDASNVFKEIRLVKTEPEIVLLREAAQRNEAALDHAISRIAPGVALEDIEWAHAEKWAALKGHSKWLIANVHGLNSGCVAAGDFLKLDSVGTYCGYHGDVGRTVMVGTPPDELARRIEANTKVSRIIYDAIRPGMKYVEASRMFVDLMRDEGVERAFAGAHDVGLEHTDHPVPTGGKHVPGSIDYAELTFEAGTVFTLDMPYNEIGWGTTHVEDMILIREKGYEPLSSMRTDLVIRPT